MVALPVIDLDRPQTRADCEDGPRPCPYLSCRANLLADVTYAGTLEVAGRKISLRRLGTSEAELDAAAERIAAHEGPSCALDVAGDGSSTLEEVGAIFGVTRERVRQIEADGLRRLRRDLGLRDLHEAAEAVRASPDSALAAVMDDERDRAILSKRRARAKGRG